WLRAADGSPYITENLASFNHGISINEGKYLRRNFRGFVGNKNLNPNLIPLGSVQYHGNNRQIKGQDGGNDALGVDRLVYGPMDLVLDEEDDPIALLEGKKRQRIVEATITGFYENPDKRRRSASWDLLRQLNHDQSIPWVVLDDFNEIANSFEKKGGRLRSDRHMREFCEALDNCSVTDLGFVGWWFTWERGRFVSTNIRERLDHGVATLSLVNLFPGYQLEHLSYSFSDHCPLLLDSMGVVWNNQDSLVKPFRFEAKWCLDSSFEGMVKRWWDDNSGSVLGKLEELGHHLLNWSKSNGRKEKGNRIELKDRFTNLYNQDLSDEILVEITEKVAIQHHFCGRIMELQDKNVGRANSSEEFVQIASNYFGNLFSASDIGLDEHLFGLVEKKVIDSMNDVLLKKFIEEEIAYAVKLMAPLKAPGVD
ncbi:hypothetical protein Golob_019897, partial [Gossypium lobatum]|nr:hypothetical protein [Gossypium lobatum]